MKMNSNEEAEDRNNRVFDETIELKDNAMLSHRKELFDEWDFEKNNELGLDVYKITYGSGKVAWWNCPDCSSPYDMSVYDRAGKKKGNCPYCRGYRINHTNSLFALRPDIASEWHPTKNESLTPHDFVSKSNKPAWWICIKGHDWKTGIDNRTKEDGTGCPYCLGQRAWKGHNDMWTTSPDLASQLLNPEDGYKYTQHSNVKVDWECSICENTIKNKSMNNINKRGLSCSSCSDGISFGEKLVYNLLKVNGINFVYDESREWTQGKRYDFYFELNGETCIIETHGIQHYESSRRGRTLEEEQENDRFKESLARENGIDNYIVIDCRYSNIDWIKNSILNSSIVKIVDHIDFERVNQLSANSFVKVAADLWNVGNKKVSEIAKRMHVSHPTAASYLKKGTEIGWCEYIPEASLRFVPTLPNKAGSIPVVQLDGDYNLIRVWSSAREASITLNIPKTIHLVCKGRQKTAGGFKWMYKEDYDKQEIQH